MEDISSNEVGRTYQDFADSFPRIIARNEQQERFHPCNKDRWSKQAFIK
jgi:hypothetical protein